MPTRDLPGRAVTGLGPLLGLGLGLGLALAGSSTSVAADSVAATRPAADGAHAAAAADAVDTVDAGPAHHPPPPLLCAHVFVGLDLPLLALVLDLLVNLNTCPAPPPTTTTLPPTTAPPPPPTTTTLAPTTTLPPPTTTTTLPPTITTLPAPALVQPPPTTTTTTAPPPVPVPATPPPPRLSLTATLNPDPPAPGALAAARLVVRNDGAQAVDDLTLTDDLSQNTSLRSASSPTGQCLVVGRRAECRLGSLAPGDSVTTEVRLLVDRDPASHSVSQHVTLTTRGGDHPVRITDRAISTMIDNRPASGSPLLALPGTTVTVVAFVGFVLAAGPSTQSRAA